MSANREHLSVKELAAALGVSTKTIFRAKRRGFQMPGKVATVAEYRAWHAAAIADVSRNVPFRVMPRFQ